MTLFQLMKRMFYTTDLKSVLTFILDIRMRNEKGYIRLLWPTAVGQKCGRNSFELPLCRISLRLQNGK